MTRCELVNCCVQRRIWPLRNEETRELVQKSFTAGDDLQPPGIWNELKLIDSTTEESTDAVPQRQTKKQGEAESSLWWSSGRRNERESEENHAQEAH